MWVDEIVDLEWDLHRLRRTRHAVLEERLVDRLASMAASGLGRSRAPAQGLLSLENLRHAARGCVRGVREATDVVERAIGYFSIDDELQAVRVDAVDSLARIESSIHATSRLRDAILSRLYGRRDAIADGRIRSGSAQ